MNNISEFFEEQSIIEKEQLFEEDIFLDLISEINNMTNIPQWIQILFENQQMLLQQIQNQIAQNHSQDTHSLRAKYIYKFQLFDSSDNIDYYFFMKYIKDLII